MTYEKKLIKELADKVLLDGLANSEDGSWFVFLDDIKEYHVDVVVMGSDWAGSDKFDYLKEYCEVVYLDRTPGVSTSQIKQDLGLQEAQDGVDQVPNT